MKFACDFLNHMKFIIDVSWYLYECTYILFVFISHPFTFSLFVLAAVHSETWHPSPSASRFVPNSSIHDLPSSSSGNAFIRCPEENTHSETHCVRLFHIVLFTLRRT